MKGLIPKSSFHGTYVFTPVIANQQCYSFCNSLNPRHRTSIDFCCRNSISWGCWIFLCNILSFKKLFCKCSGWVFHIILVMFPCRTKHINIDRLGFHSCSYAQNSGSKITSGHVAIMWSLKLHLSDHSGHFTYLRSDCIYLATKCSTLKTHYNSFGFPPEDLLLVIVRHWHWT